GANRRLRQEHRQTLDRADSGHGARLGRGRYRPAGPAGAHRAEGRARRLRRRRRHQGARRVEPGRGDRPRLPRPIPRAADLHDGGSAHHHGLHASSVHGQEHRARRRPRHQHRRADQLPQHRPELRRDPAQGQRRALHDGCRVVNVTTAPSRRETQNSTVKPRVLIVEDETALVELLRYNLEQAGFQVKVAYDGEEALASVHEDAPDLVLLDWMLPLMSGIEVCRQLRRQTATANLPIIMLTARGEEGDRVRGLDAGADDYVPKPFSPTELVARIRAVLRRIRPALADEALSYADIVMDLVAHRVIRGGKPVHLGPTEFRLLRHFMEHPGRVFSREQLLDAVWGKDVYVEARTVDVHIRRLRIALNGDNHADVIRTVRAAGYAL